MGPGDRPGTNHRLLLANRTLDDPAIDASLAARPGDTRWTVVVPATPPDAAEAGFLASEHLGRGIDETAGVALARWRLARALDRLRDAGLDVRGEIGHRDPLRAAASVLQRDPADEIVLALLPGDRSVWRRRRVAHHLAARHGVPVVTVTASGGGNPPGPRRALSRGATER